MIGQLPLIATSAVVGDGTGTVVLPFAPAGAYAAPDYEGDGDDGGEGDGADDDVFGTWSKACCALTGLALV